MKIYFKDVRDLRVLRNAIRDLNNKVPKDDKAKNNIKVSIEAINRVIAMRFYNILVNNYDVISPDDKSLEIDDINININPDLVFRYTEDGIVKLGALKFHVSKSKPFDLNQSKHLANILKVYLQEKVKQAGEVVDERLCWSYDVFTDRLVHGEANPVISSEIIKTLCTELKKIHGSL